MERYTPPQHILENYAAILINWALHSGGGVRPGETVVIQVPECAKPLYVPLRNTVLRAGAYPIMQFLPDDVSVADIYTIPTDEQLGFFPDKYLKGLVDQADHTVSIIAEHDKYELQGVEPRRLFLRSKAFKPFMDWRDAKEAAGKFTWTLAMYATPAMAADVGMTEKEYWDQIIAACFLDAADPIQAWKDVTKEIERTQHWLNSLEIESVHIEAEDIDLIVQLGADRKWLGGTGRNIPSFELFISPDWRGTEGVISFNQPLFRYGTVIRDIRLRFERGRVVEATASEGEEVLREMIATEHADKIGEFSLTAASFSRITRIMGETLYDENIGGSQGNTHIALGNAYQDSYRGDPTKLSAQDWAERGFNSSVVHTDIISTSKRKVTARLTNGTSLVIYENGEFTLREPEE